MKQEFEKGDVVYHCIQDEILIVKKISNGIVESEYIGDCFSGVIYNTPIDLLTLISKADFK